MNVSVSLIYLVFLTCSLNPHFIASVQVLPVNGTSLFLYLDDISQKSGVA